MSQIFKETTFSIKSPSFDGNENISTHTIEIKPNPFKRSTTSLTSIKSSSSSSKPASKISFHDLIAIERKRLRSQSNSSPSNKSLTTTGCFPSPKSKNLNHFKKILADTILSEKPEKSAMEELFKNGQKAVSNKVVPKSSNLSDLAEESSSE